MSDPSLWSSLAELSHAEKSAREAALARVSAEERKLRETLAVLNRSHQSAKNLSVEKKADLQRIGGDILWQGWVSQKREDLQMQLAQVLARKADALYRLRQAHGKSTAVDSVCARQIEDRHRKLIKSNADRMLDLMLMFGPRG